MALITYIFLTSCLKNNEPDSYLVEEKYPLALSFTVYVSNLDVGCALCTN